MEALRPGRLLMMKPADAQRLRALGKANWVRSSRVSLRRALAAGEVDIYRLLAGNDEKWEAVIEGQQLEALLLTLPGIGPATTEDILLETRLSGRLTPVALTYGRRLELADLVRRVLTGTEQPPREGTE